MKGFLVLLLAVPACLGAEANGSLLQTLRSKLRDASSTEASICQQIYQQEIRPDFSACLNEADVSGQNGKSTYDVDCAAQSMQNYQSCSSEPACSWWHLSGKQLCMANPCYRINNGRCTIQNTGGRCVWYSKSQNKQVRGIDAPGCYKSPCNNPLVNNPNGCRNAGDGVYNCVWCKKHNGIPWGCQNDKMESEAQCWNIGQSNKCNNCKGSLGISASCSSTKCADECCESPLCKCQIDDARAPGDIGNDIITG